MNLDALVRPGTDTGRFFLVDYLPTYAAGLMLASLVSAGAPGPLEAERVWRTASGLGVGQIVFAALAMTLLAVLFHPLQLPLVRLLEGQWPALLAPLTRWSRRRQINARRRLAALEGAVEDALEELPDGDAPLDEARIQAAGHAGTLRRIRFPAEELCRPTGLGNVLAAMETGAGDAYGYDAVVAWPRLYPVLGNPVRSIVDDRRNVLDATARLSVIMAVTGLAALALLAFSGWAVLLAAIPLAVAWIAYRAAIHAAMAYSEAVVAAFDLHRFDLTAALHLPLPADDATERLANARLCDSWRQGLENPTEYEHRDGLP